MSDRLGFAHEASTAVIVKEPKAFFIPKIGPLHPRFVVPHVGDRPLIEHHDHGSRIDLSETVELKHYHAHRPCVVIVHVTLGHDVPGCDHNLSSTVTLS